MRTSLSMIATEVGISKPTIYYYFSSKEAILQDFLDGFETVLAHGITLGVVSPNKATTNAHILALVADNISNFMMMGIKANYKQIWETAVSNVIKGTR